MEYVHLPELAPTKEMLDSYRKDHRSWDTYESEFLALMEQRRIGEKDLRRLVADACLLCSEDKPDRCHRRLVAEYLQRDWGEIDIVHLG